MVPDTGEQDTGVAAYVRVGVRYHKPTILQNGTTTLMINTYANQTTASAIKTEPLCVRRVMATCPPTGITYRSKIRFHV